MQAHMPEEKAPGPRPQQKLVRERCWKCKAGLWCPSLQADGKKCALHRQVGVHKLLAVFCTLGSVHSGPPPLRTR